MLGDMKNHYFMDISDIYQKDVDVQFSVEHVLENDDYLMTPQRKEKNKKSKGSEKKTRGMSKKGTDIQLRNANQDGEKVKKKVFGSKLNIKEELLEKDTQDNSETVKILKRYFPPKVPIGARSPKPESKSIESKMKIMSNKVQPGQKQRSRTKSITSAQSPRRPSQLNIVETHGIPSKTNILIGKSNSNSQLTRNRSQTKRGIIEQLKIENENIVRNDYFEEIQNAKRPKINRYSGAQGSYRKRSLSNSKKMDFQSKKMKKIAIVHERGDLQSPRTIKK